jgi:hypothetical protein
MTTVARCVARAAHVAMLAAWLLGAVPHADAQDGLRATFAVKQGGGQKVELAGTVTNGRGDDVVDVHVTAEALDRKGQVVATGITYVEGRIRSGDSRPFVAVVPAVPGAARYRVSVTSFRALGMQAP